MSLTGFLHGRWQARQANRAHRRTLADADAAMVARALSDWPRSLQDPTGFYLNCHRYFHLTLPAEMRAHRAFFQENGRGFGEDAFHVLWWLLFEKFRPTEFLEIGVFRGQTLSLAGLLQKRFDCTGTVAGISPFEAVGDSVSEYRGGVDYEADTRANCARFGGTPPTLRRAYSTAPEAVEFIGSRVWQCIYIDGNHDYDIALADWTLCARHLAPGGVIVLDDSGLTTAFEPPAFATKGHPGPSRVAAEIDRTAFTEILQVGHNRVFQKR
jgi:hypothetical protein